MVKAFIHGLILKSNMMENGLEESDMDMGYGKAC
jgi:hypothetical protein